ncbi:MAG: cryptochrome/photolyase family protein, partial [Sphingobacteriales bacterium]
MKEATIIFPHQLFKDNPAVKPGRICYLLEESLFFTQYHFHQQKILLHRASMKAYAHYLAGNGVKVEYIDTLSGKAAVAKLLYALAGKYSTIHFTDPVDEWLNKRIDKACLKYNIEKKVYPSPSFLNKMEAANKFFNGKSSYFQTAFYIDQRKQRNILVTAPNEPAGGRWSYDEDNRLKFPAKQKAPGIKFPPDNEYVAEAQKYVKENFHDHYGSTEAFNYPVNFMDAEKWLDEFIAVRLQQFGVYEDAIVANEHYLHHSVLSPLINIGLLTPQQVIDKAMH